LNNNSLKIGIICGYGVILDENLKGYLNSVLEYLEIHNINTIILSGGRTGRHSNMSEAQIMSDFIKAKTNIKILKEENSFKTSQNLHYSKRIIDNLKFSKYKIFLFCDYLRFIKVLLLSNIIFKNIETKVIRIKRKEKFIVYLIQIPSTFFQLLDVIYNNVIRKIENPKKKND